MTRFDLGVGITVTAASLDLLASLEGRIDVAEIEPQSFWTRTGDGEGQCRPSLDLYRSIAGLAPSWTVHGVGAPVGGTVRPAISALEGFGECVDALGAVLASEHLAFNAVPLAGEEVCAGTFLPPSQDQSGVAAAAAAIDDYQRTLPDVPFLFEPGTNYLRARPNELADGEFFHRVAQTADCGILLDLHSLWASERNRRQPVRDVIDQLPLERVLEVHLGGGFRYRGYWLDAHSGLVPPAVMTLAEEVLPRLPKVRAVVFEILPEHARRVGTEAIVTQLDEIRRLIERPHRRSSATRPSAPCPLPPSIAMGDRMPTAPAARWEAALGSAVLASSRRRSEDPGLDILRRLIRQGRVRQLTADRPLLSRSDDVEPELEAVEERQECAEHLDITFDRDLVGSHQVIE